MSSFSKCVEIQILLDDSFSVGWDFWACLLALFLKAFCWFSCPLLWRYNFLSVSQSVMIQSLWWKSRPKMSSHVWFCNLWMCDWIWVFMNLCSIYFVLLVLNFGTGRQKSFICAWLYFICNVYFFCRRFADNRPRSTSVKNCRYSFFVYNGLNRFTIT